MKVGISVKYEESKFSSVEQSGRGPQGLVIRKRAWKVPDALLGERQGVTVMQGVK